MKEEKRKIIMICTECVAKSNVIVKIDTENKELIVTCLTCNTIEHQGLADFKENKLKEKPKKVIN